MSYSIYRTTTMAIPAALASLLMGGYALAQQAFDLDALIAAAKTEAPITIYDSSARILEIADNFTALYGVKATGRKIDAHTQTEMVIRESQANNVQGDVLRFADAPSVMAELIPQGFIANWVPPDMAAYIDPMYQNPLVLSFTSQIWAYNTEVHSTCPIKNIWELTEDKWLGKVAVVDPLSKGIYTDWFNQMEMHGDDAIADAYQDYFGAPLDSGAGSATKAWVAALAANRPLQADTDAGAADAVGAPGQAEPFILGLMHASQFKLNASKGYKLGLCVDLKPWIGFTVPKLNLISAQTKSPNASKLFVRYAMTEDGMKTLLDDFNVSANTSHTPPAQDPNRLHASSNQLLKYVMATALDDYDTRQDWQDFWRINYKK